MQVMLKKVLLGLAAIVVLFLLIVAVQPADFAVTRSTLIAAPADAVFPHVNELRKWDGWDPWAKLDPKCVTTYTGPESGEGASFAWDSNSSDVGKGKMTVLKTKPNESVELQLDFSSPMKCTNQVYFTFVPEGDKTKVTWKMAGKKNFLAKAFTMFCSMDKMVGGDFEKGLASLKAIAEGKPAETPKE
jgi:hypothetical protein